jgi:hypothetical protein
MNQIIQNQANKEIAFKESAKVLKFVGLLPSVFIFFSLVFYFFIALKVGHLPTYENPQPADFPELEILQHIILFSFGLSFWAIPAFLMCLVNFALSENSDFGFQKLKIIFQSSLGTVVFIAATKIPQLSEIVFWIFD